jgi:hypothetical protein
MKEVDASVQVCVVRKTKEEKETNVPHQRPPYTMDYSPSWSTVCVVCVARYALRTVRVRALARCQPSSTH